MNFTDGALDEQFCLTPNARGPYYIKEDQALMEATSTDVLLMRTGFSRVFDQSKRDTYVRFCYGSFLLAWQPDSSYYQFGGSVSVGQLDPEVLDELNVNLGMPTGPVQRTGSLDSRAFDNGTVYVNYGTENVTVSADRPFIEVRTGTAQRRPAGEDVVLEPDDAAFLLDGDLTSSP